MAEALFDSIHLLVSAFVRKFQPRNNDIITPLKLEEGLLNKSNASYLDNITISSKVSRDKPQSTLKHSRSIFYGRRALSKPIVTKCHILSHLKKSKNHHVLVFHGVEKAKPTYSIFLESCGEFSTQCEIHATYNSTIIKQFMTKHQDMPVDHLMIIFDDCFDLDNNKCPLLKTLLCSDINIVILADHPLTVPPFIRCQVEQLYLFKEHVYVYRKKVFETYGLWSIFGSFAVFDNMWKRCTDIQNGYLIVDLKQHTCFVGRFLMECGM